MGPNAAGGTGTGGQSAGSGTNGGSFGFSIAGGGESGYGDLVEGQETADAIGGFSHTNVPFAFIQEMQVKSSGVEAEYGGALGGVVNVIMQKGSNKFHGSVFSQFESSTWDGSPSNYPRYDPTFLAGATIGGALADPSYQSYQPKRLNSGYLPRFHLRRPLLEGQVRGSSCHSILSFTISSGL